MGKNTQSLREFSSGGIVFKKDKWLIRATAASSMFPKVYWMLPKGWIDDVGPGIPGPIASGKVRADEESLQKAAVREVAEEGGVVAKIVKKIGTEKYVFKHPERGNILKFVTFYLMKFVCDLPEGHDDETSEILWLPFDEAKKKLSFGGEKEMLTRAQELLSQVLVA